MSLLRFRRLMQPLSRSLAAESVLVLLQWCGRKRWQRQLEVSPKARACRTKLVSSFIATWTAWCCESWPVKVKWGWTWPGSSWLGSSAAPAIGGSASSRLSAPVNNNTDNNKLEELKKTKNDYLSADWSFSWFNSFTLTLFTETLPRGSLHLTAAESADFIFIYLHTVNIFRVIGYFSTF